jgi:hypothetical protein
MDGGTTCRNPFIVLRSIVICIVNEVHLLICIIIVVINDMCAAHYISLVLVVHVLHILQLCKTGANELFFINFCRCFCDDRSHDSCTEGDLATAGFLLISIDIMFNIFNIIAFNDIINIIAFNDIIG